jgi:predicted transcriptional regulator
MAKQPKGIVEQLRQAIRAAGRKGQTAYVIAKAAGIARSQLTYIAQGRIVRLDTAERILATMGCRLAIVRADSCLKRTHRV